jgi:hypothetical protein
MYGARALDAGAELRQCVDLTLETAPILAISPVVDEPLSFIERAPWDQPPTVSRAGHRVAASRRLRSPIAVCADNDRPYHSPGY